MKPERPGRINIDLQGYKADWIAYCRGRGTTPSDAFRQIVAKLLAAEQGREAERTMEADAPEKPARRCEIKLTPSEYRVASAIAKRDGFALPRWIVGLIRSRLTSTPQFGQQELEVLARSNLNLLAIGRNLNQVAKALNVAKADRGVYRVELIEQIWEMVKEHAAHVAVAIAANTERWRIR